MQRISYIRHRRQSYVQGLTYARFAAYICGVNYNCKGSLHSTTLAVSLTYTHTHLILLSCTFTHTLTHRSTTNTQTRLDLVPHNQLIRRSLPAAHRQLFMRTRKYPVPNLNYYGSLPVTNVTDKVRNNGFQFSLGFFVWRTFAPTSKTIQKQKRKKNKYFVSEMSQMS